MIDTNMNGKKKSKLVWIIVIAVVLIGAGITAFFIWGMPKITGSTLTKVDTADYTFYYPSTYTTQPVKDELGNVVQNYQNSKGAAIRLFSYGSWAAPTDQETCSHSVKPLASETIEKSEFTTRGNMTVCLLSYVNKQGSGYHEDMWIGKIGSSDKLIGGGFGTTTGFYKLSIKGYDPVADAAELKILKKAQNDFVLK